jgi:hypothetical protein
MDKQFSRIRAYILVKEVATMVVKINSKPIVVREEEVKKVNWMYLSVTVIGYGLIFWIIRLAAITFLGGM